MGITQSTHSQLFTLQKDVDQKHRSPVLKAFIDYYRFPKSGIVGIGSLSNPQ